MDAVLLCVGRLTHTKQGLTEAALGLRRELIHSVIGSIVGVFVAFLLLLLLYFSFRDPAQEYIVDADLAIVFVAIAVPMLFWPKTLITAVHGFSSYGIVAFIVFVLYLCCIVFYHILWVKYGNNILMPGETFVIPFGFVVAGGAVALLFVLRRRHQRAMTSGGASTSPPSTS